MADHLILDTLRIKDEAILAAAVAETVGILMVILGTSCQARPVKDTKVAKEAANIIQVAEEAQGRRELVQLITQTVVPECPAIY